MEIELPDGTILDAPDGADTRAVVRGYRLNKLKAANPAEYDPQSKEFADRWGPLSKGRTTKSYVRGVGEVTVPEDDVFTEGLGSGMVDMTRNLGNLQNRIVNKHPLIKAMGGIDMPGKDIYSDEAIQEQRALDAPLAKSAKGATGQALGKGLVAYGVTAPLSGLGGLSTSASALPRALGHPTTRAALEGAIGGAGASSPGEYSEGGLKGALLSATIERFFAGGGRVLRGLVQKSEDTKALQQLAAQQGEDIFVPISQGAGDQDIPTKFAKMAYGEGLSLVPFVRGQLNRQSSRAAEKVRELAIREATPTGVHLPGRPGHEVQESLASIRQGFDDVYDETIGALDFHIPGNLRTKLIQKIKQDSPKIDDESVDKAMLLARGLMRRFSNGNPTIEGSGLLTVRNQLRAAADKAADFERPAYVSASKVIDDMIEQRLKVQGLYDRFADLEEPARHLKGLEAAVRSARPNSGRFTPQQLARSAEDPTQLDLAQTAAGAMKGPAAGTSFAGRSLLSSAATLGGLYHEPITASTVLLGANLLATKTAQKALMGDTAAQQAIVELLKKNPQAAQAVERALRQAAVTQTGE